jgi:hypothetical protein
LLSDEPTTVCARVVSGQAAQDLAALRFQHSASGPHGCVDRVAQVSRDAFTQPADHVKRPAENKPSAAATPNSSKKWLRSNCAPLPASLVSPDQPAVNQAAKRQREGQGGQSGHHQNSPARTIRSRYGRKTAADPTTSGRAFIAVAAPMKAENRC